MRLMAPSIGLATRLAGAGARPQFDMTPTADMAG